MIKYRMNLVKSIRFAEKRGFKHLANMVLMAIICFGLLGASGYYVWLQVTAMDLTLERERQTIKKIEAEYRNYQEMQSTVDKADIELLDKLLADRIYWTRTLEAMASHLPDEQPTSYWITKFGYREQSRTFSARGYGYITDKQEQLLALDEYLNKLRADPSYTEAFGSTALRSAIRSDEDDRRAGGAHRERVSFEYASMRKGGK